MVQQRVLPMPEEMIRRYQEALFSTDRSLGLDLVALALVLLFFTRETYCRPLR